RGPDVGGAGRVDPDHLGDVGVRRAAPAVAVARPARRPGGERDLAARLRQAHFLEDAGVELGVVLAPAHRPVAVAAAITTVVAVLRLMVRVGRILRRITDLPEG